MFVLGENHFRKCFSGNEAIWLVRKILFSGNWNPLTGKKCLWPWKSFYTSIFPSKYFRKMRERERERARARERRRNIPVSPTIAGELRALVCADLASSSPTTAIWDRDWRFARSRRRSRSRAVDRDLAKIEIALSIAISRR